MASATFTSTPASASPEALGTRLQALGFGGLVAALVCAPWPLGSNRPWAVALLAAMVWASVVLAAVGAVWRAPAQARGRGQPALLPAPLPTLLPALVPTLLPALVPTLLPALVPAAWLPLGALLGFAGLVVLQLLPGLGPNGGLLSIDPFHTRRYLLTTLLYLGGWLLVLLTVNTRERAEKLLAALLAAGVNNDGLLPLPLRSTR